MTSMTVIAQRELRNQVSNVLKRAEQGEYFTVTVDGRPVAELRPLPAAHKPAAPDRLSAVLGDTPVDADWAAELRELREADAAAADDPWAD
jgi:prevent-host-death family protein